MTMASLKSSAPAMPSGSRQFDPEIKDMANYIHHYKIDSDLAVCLPSILVIYLQKLTESHCL